MTPISELILEIRTFYNMLVERGEALHGDLDITLGMRAMLEVLNLRGAMTVPALARDRRVSRQRVQALINALLDRGLVVRGDNPSNQRSFLIDLSPAGRRLLRDMQHREQALFERADLEIGNAELVRLTERLQLLRQQLDAAAETAAARDTAAKTGKRRRQSR